VGEQHDAALGVGQAVQQLPGAGGGDGGGEGSIWVLLPDTASSDRWEKDDRRFFAEAFEAAGLSEGDDFTIVNAEGDANTQQSQAEQAISDGASVIVLTSLDTGSGATIIDQAKEADVQVVEYDRFNTGGSGGAASRRSSWSMKRMSLRRALPMRKRRSIAPVPRSISTTTAYVPNG
jgi:ABC-type sugar transport system substrate-binding protein